MERLKIIVKRIKDQAPKEYVVPQDRTVFTIGSDRQCDVVVSRPGVEDRHLQITRNTHGFTLVPLTLRGEVAFNSSILKRPVRLSHRDSITIADTKIIILDLDREATAPDSKTPFAAPLKPQPSFEVQQAKKKKRSYLGVGLLLVLLLLGAVLCLNYINPFLPKQLKPFSDYITKKTKKNHAGTTQKTAVATAGTKPTATLPRDVDSITLEKRIKTPFSAKALIPVLGPETAQKSHQANPKPVPAAQQSPLTTKQPEGILPQTPAKTPQPVQTDPEQPAAESPRQAPPADTVQPATKVVSAPAENQNVKIPEPLPEESEPIRQPPQTEPETQTLPPMQPSENTEQTQQIKTPEKVKEAQKAAPEKATKPDSETAAPALPVNAALPIQPAAVLKPEPEVRQQTAYASKPQLDAIRLTYDQGKISSALAELKTLTYKHPQDQNVKQLNEQITQTAAIWNNLQRQTRAPQQYILARQLSAHERSMDNYYAKQARSIISKLVQHPIPLSEECYQMGLKSRAKNRHEQAFEYFKSAYTLNPSNTRAKLEADRMQRIVSIKRKSLKKAGAAVNDKARSERILKRLPQSR